MKVWILPFLLLVTATLIAFPLSRYMTWIMEGKYERFPSSPGLKNAWTADPRAGSNTAAPCFSSTRSCSSSASLFFSSSHGCRLIPDCKGMLAPEHDFHSIVIVHDQYGSAALCRGSESVEFQPDLLRDRQPFPLSRNRPECLVRDHKGPSRLLRTRELLSGYVEGTGLHVRAYRFCRRPRIHDCKAAR